MRNNEQQGTDMAITRTMLNTCVQIYPGCMWLRIKQEKTLKPVSNVHAPRAIENTNQAMKLVILAEEASGI